MRCGNCKDDHASPAEVKECYANAGKIGSPPSDKQIKYVLDLQRTRHLPAWWPIRTEETLRTMERGEVSKDIDQLKTFTLMSNDPKSRTFDVPAGRYALLMKTSVDDSPAWRFFEVRDGNGKWKGFKFTKRLIGSPGDYQKKTLPRALSDEILALIEKDVQKAMTDYGLQSGVCGHCSSPLTNPVSLARGIGPICAGKLGW